MVYKAVVAGYRGIYLNTAGYEDGGKEIGDKLSAILNEKPIISDTKDQVFYNLTNYRRQLLEELGQKEIEKQQREVLSLPILVNWNKGFYPLEKDQGDNWNWSKKESSITIVNENESNKKIVLEFYPVSNYPEPSNLYMGSDLFSKRLKINGKKQLFRVNLTVPHGVHKITFKTDSKKVEAPNEARDLYFRLFNFRLKEL